MTQPIDYIFHGESLDFLKALPENYVDLIMTSPPYADNRKSTYVGVPMDQYVETANKQVLVRQWDKE